MADVVVPCAEEHRRVQILVRLCSQGSTSGFDFTRVVDRLRRIDVLTVSENPLRVIHPHFVTTFDPEKVVWGEFQAHRRILGLLCIGYAPETAAPDWAIETFLEQYRKLKTEWMHSLVDNRCLLFGFDFRADAGAECLFYPSMEESEALEMDMKEYLKSIFWVLESKRLDLSFEKMDSPPCPIVAKEEKYRVGVENKNSKVYRRKCIGRLRKQIADYTLMTGLPTLALDTYSAAIDLLKSSNDWLWLAGAYEGWACAAIVAKYVRTRRQSIPRVPTFTSSQLKTTLSRVQSSDERRMSDHSPSTNLVRLTLSAQDIVDKLRLALDNYEKYSFAAAIEYESIIKASAVFTFERQYYETEVFMREHCGKYLDDNFTQFDHEQKANVCLISATIFRRIGFHRKSAFFLRLAALFRLRTTTGQPASEQDYKHVYPLLYSALQGCRVPESVRDMPEGPVKGWPTVMLRAMHEVFLTALQAGYREAAVRHACYMLQAFYEDVDEGFIKQLCAEMEQLCEGKIHNAHTHLQLPSSIILPPLPMNKFPVVQSFKVQPLPKHLLPKVKKDEQSVFIYTPFKRAEDKTVRWVVGCNCAVELTVANLLPIELKVTNLTLQTEGVEFDAVPVELNLPPFPSEAVPVKLLGIPKSTGRLVIAGYSCSVLSVRNVCRLRDVPWLSSLTTIDVDVLPALPEIQLTSSLPRIPASDSKDHNTAEVTVYSGQTFEHCIKLQNVSVTEKAAKISLSIVQPSVSGGPKLIELENGQEFLENGMEPEESREIKFKIFGVDPMCTADDDGAVSERSLDARTAASSHDSSSKSVSLVYGERIPYTGRLLTATFIFRYEANTSDSDAYVYERTVRLSLCVTVVPAVTVADWHVLPGDSTKTRFLVLDVMNSTESEAELLYSESKQMQVQSKETCRVPLLCPCCDTPSCSSEKRNLLVAMEETERLRRRLEKHVAKHLNIKWTIPSMDLEGYVPVGPLLASMKLLRQLVLPPLSIGVSVNGSLAHGKDEHTFSVGELIALEVELSSSLEKRQFHGFLSLNCYQDLQNSLPPLDRSEHLLFSGPVKQPFALIENPVQYKCTFRFLFCYEGLYKVKPDCRLLEKSQDLNDCDLFVPTLAFNIITKSL